MHKIINFLLFFVKKLTFFINLVDLCGFCGFFLKIDFSQTFWSHCTVPLASAGTVKAHPANETTELLGVPEGACLPRELGRLQ